MLKREGEALAHLDPKGMEAYLLEISDGGRLWCDRVVEGVRGGERHCLRLFAEALKWVGIQQSVALIMVQKLGVRDEAELGSLVGRGRKLAELESMPESEQQKLCESYLEDVYRRDAVAWRAFRERVDGMSRAEEVAS